MTLGKLCAYTVACPLANQAIHQFHLLWVGKLVTEIYQGVLIRMVAQVYCECVCVCVFYVCMQKAI